MLFVRVEAAAPNATQTNSRSLTSTHVSFTLRNTPPSDNSTTLDHDNDDHAVAGPRLDHPPRETSGRRAFTLLHAPRIGCVAMHSDKGNEDPAHRQLHRGTLAANGPLAESRAVETLFDRQGEARSEDTQNEVSLLRVSTSAGGELAGFALMLERADTAIPTC